MQNFGVTNKEHYGMLWYFLEWSIKLRPTSCVQGREAEVRNIPVFFKEFLNDPS